VIVKDLLELSPEEDIARELLALCTEDATESQEDLQSVLKLITRIKTITPVETDGLLLSGYYSDDGEEQFDTALFHKAELAAFKPDPVWDCIDTVDALSDEEIERLIPLLDLPHSYAYELSPWNEILGYAVNPENISAVGGAKFAAAILDEMTFFGSSEDEIDQTRQELHESMAEVKAILQLPSEERENRLCNVEDLFAKYGIRDERTEEEKAQHSRAMSRLVLENNLRTFRMIKQYGGFPS
jgi:hypothetical protein